ncbi:hypothetical protein KC131_23990 [Pseudomonas sp. JQ170]|uniref:hypothetical protein n=1 Tax=unclassified Pseudomonas TaxID=196821 RepID=UPI00264CB533|nr:MULTISPECIES: hypothetical protein [unclassified Pseudomonas]MDN7143715.1 hypothetical protein [Pseudomonas sp. JQ170]WRO74115.1 hypothetical protein U9R80_16440 [Pseudomonas sp. 170C]
MKGIRDDLHSTARELERVSRELDGHARYLLRSIHRTDAAEVLGQIQGLQASVEQLRDVAHRISR